MNNLNNLNIPKNLINGNQSNGNSANNQSNTNSTSNPNPDKTNNLQVLPNPFSKNVEKPLDKLSNALMEKYNIPKHKRTNSEIPNQVNPQILSNLSNLTNLTNMLTNKTILYNSNINNANVGHQSNSSNHYSKSPNINNFGPDNQNNEKHLMLINKNENNDKQINIKQNNNISPNEAGRVAVKNLSINK